MLDKTKNYKIDVTDLNMKERAKLQEKLFEMGYVWYYGGKEVNMLEAVTLFLSPMKILFGDKKAFSSYDYPIITVSDIMSQPKERTLRDWFAGLAMVQLMQEFETQGTVGRAYELADAMLKERNK